jgi:hypothetical protein
VGAWGGGSFSYGCGRLAQSRRTLKRAQSISRTPRITIGLSITAEEQAELRAIVNSTRSDIVFDPEHVQGVA